MKIIPSISIREGQVVEASDGSYFLLRDNDDEAVDPRDLLLELKKEFGIVHVLDTDGIQKNTPNLKLIQQSTPLMPIWIYAGSRDIMGAMDVLVAGVSKLIIGTRNLRDLKLLVESYEMTDNVMISFDHDSSLLCPSQNLLDMGAREIARRVKKIGITTALFFDLGRLSHAGELDLREIRMLQEIFEEVYVAGILSPADIDRLAEMEISGIIVDFKSLREWGIEGKPEDWNGYDGSDDPDAMDGED